MVGSNSLIVELLFSRRRTLRTRGIKMLVLDEADEMLNKGFKEQIYDVYRFVSNAGSFVAVAVVEWLIVFD